MFLAFCSYTSFRLVSYVEGIKSSHVTTFLATNCNLDIWSINDLVLRVFPLAKANLIAACVSSCAYISAADLSLKGDNLVMLSNSPILSSNPIVTVLPSNIPDEKGLFLDISITTSFIFLVSILLIKSLR